MKKLNKNQEGILEKLKTLEMIEIDNGKITIKNWHKRQSWIKKLNYYKQ